MLAPHFYRLTSDTDVPPLAQRAAARGASGYVLSHADEGLRFRSPERVEAAVLAQTRYEEELTLARDLRDLGLERYRELDIERAIDALERARASYARTQHELLSPGEVSEVLFYLALSYLERGEGATQALGVLREMILIDPSRQPRSGLFPEHVVEAYELARRGLIEELERRGLPLELDAKARALAALTQSDEVAFGFVVPATRSEAPFLARLFIWSASSGEVEFADAQPLNGVEDERVIEDIFSRMTARWADCLAPPVIERASPGERLADPQEGLTRRFSLGLSGLYGTYLDFPRLRPDLGPAPPGAVAHLGHLGVGVHVRWALRQELSLISRAQLWLSQREHSGLIEARDVTAVRGFVGVEFGRRFGRLRPAVQLSLEAAHVSDFSILGEIGCAPRAREGECAPELSSQTYEGYDFLLGPSLSPQLALRLGETAELFVSTTLSYYLISTADERASINLPWGGEFGARYYF